MKGKWSYSRRSQQQGATESTRLTNSLTTTTTAATRTEQDEKDEEEPGKALKVARLVNTKNIIIEVGCQDKHKTNI